MGHGHAAASLEVGGQRSCKLLAQRHKTRFVELRLVNGQHSLSQIDIAQVQAHGFAVKVGVAQVDLVADDEATAGGFDAADDWIVEHTTADTVVITADILLADRCLKLGGTVISPTGKAFTSSSIGNAIAVRAIMSDLRAGGDSVGGPAPFSKADRSRFLSALDQALVRL